jgi:hypothetical protein
MTAKRTNKAAPTKVFEPEALLWLADRAEEKADAIALQTVRLSEDKARATTLRECARSLRAHARRIKRQRGSK